MIFGQILELLVVAWMTVLMARFFLQRGGLSFLHPLGQFCANATNWIVKPFRRLIPPIGGWDMAIIAVALFMGLMLQIAFLLIALMLGGHLGGGAIVYAILMTFMVLSKAAAYALIIGLVIQMILSFTAPYAPIVPVLSRIFKPLTQPFSALRLGRFDFSVSVVFLALWLWITILYPFIQEKCVHLFLMY